MTARTVCATAWRIFRLSGMIHRTKVLGKSMPGNGGRMACAPVARQSAARLSLVLDRRLSMG
jgi:hypothetical protein